ncbi:frataxin, mitochondrial isoform X2 [Vigna unguiculata]|uniref:ferroxidase n=1 Tax=Vigna unguiculata TaxID=3917 RepID=A0A4D6M8C3_VIGUN|nr:frataxin, mitochondrial isoform X2 [Vigna unguiculata]QCD97197.1 CyaY protein [Vigna unguiculata]
MASKLVLQRRLLRFLQLLPPSSSSTHAVPFLSVKASECTSLCRKNSLLPSHTSYSRNLCSGSFNLDESQAPLTVDYRSLLDENEFHRLADSTIHSVQEKLEDYGDLVEVDGFDIDYGNDVLTVKLGDLGTYVLNKQTPNRQLWLSSPLSGPSRFDWDRDTKAWIYRRNKANLYKILEGELEQLCGKAIVLS